MNKYLIILFIFFFLIIAGGCKKKKMKKHCCENPPYVVHFEGGYIGIANMFLADGSFLFEYHVKGTKEFNFKVSDTKGALLFEATDTNELWDGSYKDKYQLGFVNYILNAVTIFDENIQHTGQICLVDFGDKLFRNEDGTCFEYRYNCAFPDEWCDSTKNTGCDTLWNGTLKEFSKSNELSGLLNNCD